MRFGGTQYLRTYTSPFGLVFVSNSTVAEPTGLEPATSSVTGKRSNQLSYTRICLTIPVRGRANHLTI